MNIQKRVYKYNEQKINIYQKISGLADTSKLRGKWIDENTFILKHKNPLIFFHLEGDVAEMEERNKLRIKVTGDQLLLLLYILPAGLILYGLMKWPKDPEKGILLTFIGISLCIFISLIFSIIVSILKKSFRDALNIT